MWTFNSLTTQLLLNMSKQVKSKVLFITLLYPIDMSFSFQRDGTSQDWICLRNLPSFIHLSERFESFSCLPFYSSVRQPMENLFAKSLAHIFRSNCRSRRKFAQNIRYTTAPNNQNLELLKIPIKLLCVSYIMCIAMKLWSRLC